MFKKERIEKAKWIVGMYEHIIKGGELIYKDSVAFSSDHELHLYCDPTEWAKLEVREISYPQAETQKPEDGTEYFIPCVGRSDMLIKYVWKGIKINNYHFSNNLVHLIRDNAIQHTMALLGRG